MNKIVIIEKNVFHYVTAKVVGYKNGLTKLLILGKTYPNITERAEPNTYVYSAINY